MNRFIVWEELHQFERSFAYWWWDVGWHEVFYACILTGFIIGFLIVRRNNDA